VDAETDGLGLGTTLHASAGVRHCFYLHTKALTLQLGGKHLDKQRIVQGSVLQLPG